MLINVNDTFNCLYLYQYLGLHEEIILGYTSPLTHWGRMMHICVSKLTIIGLEWLVAWWARSHYLNQCWNIVKWNCRNKLQWNLQQNSHIFIQENAFENIVCKMAAILSQPQCIKLIVFNNHCSRSNAGPWGLFYYNGLEIHILWGFNLFLYKLL